MKQRAQGLIAGLLSGVMLTSGLAIAANTTTLYDVVTNGIKIVVDGKKLNPTDANGNKVEPMIYNGTTYLPVRAVANALGKAVYWDGPNYTVYLGDMGGQLEYPTVYMTELKSIENNPWTEKSVTDNYGNEYINVVKNYDYGFMRFEYLLNMKYRRFKAKLFVPSTSSEGSGYLEIIADGKPIYTSEKMTKTSRPVDIDVNITGCNDIKIRFSCYSREKGGIPMCLANAGFYQ